MSLKLIYDLIKIFNFSNKHVMLPSFNIQGIDCNSGQTEQANSSTKIMKKSINERPEALPDEVMYVFKVLIELLCHAHQINIA